MLPFSRCRPRVLDINASWYEPLISRGLPSTILTGVAVAALAYAALVAGMYAAQRSLLYLPDRREVSPQAGGVPEMEVVTLRTADGFRLASWFRAAVGDRPTLVHFHGNGGNIATRAYRMHPFLDAGYGLLMVEYRGYGSNAGAPSEQGLYADGRAALAFLDERGVPARDIVLYGESLGSGVAVQIAAERGRAREPDGSGNPGPPLAAVVLEAPLSSVTEIAAHHYPLLPVRWLLKDRYASSEKIADVSAPVLIVHGEDDGVVPIRFGRKLFAAAREPKEARWIADAGHEDLHRFGLQATVMDFITRHTGR